MFLIITRDTMFFTAMKNILSKGNVVHIQNEEEIDVMLHQNAFVIIDTLMNNVFHSNFLTQIERLKPVHVIIFSPFNIKRCLGKVPVTFVPRTIAIIDFVALINGSYCSVPEADVSLSRKQHQVLSCIANQMTTEDILDAPRDKCTLSCAINGIHAAFHYLKKNYISGCVMTVPTGW